MYLGPNETNTSLQSLSHYAPGSLFPVSHQCCHLCRLPQSDGRGVGYSCITRRLSLHRIILRICVLSMNEQIHHTNDMRKKYS